MSNARKANWSVLPSIRHWRGDTRRNLGPYYIGKGSSGNELGFAQYVKRELTSRGLRCYVALVWEDTGELV